ncbi:MAG: Maf family protein, partial [Pyramidobacter sp.]|nr:Maf family protein [Pyramidobacter sp.]
MKNLRIILASASPRRKQLLEQLGWHFEIVRPDADE